MIFNTVILLATISTTTELAFAVPTVDEHHQHRKSKRATHNTCVFPSNEGLVAVTPNEKNAGWALHSDTACTGGSYCPYACPSGQLMNQWDPEATSYTYPQSQYGGLRCNDDGTVSKPFPDRAYCVDGKGTVQVNNKMGSDVAFCQTVLPGNEEMLIPTNAGSGQLTTLAVPGTDYWASTAAHYYVNPPGVSTSQGCIWGSTANPYGNWSPYVAGANMDDSQKTYVKIGWNPKYLDDFSSQIPDFGIKITCDSTSSCVGLSCEIDPTQGVNAVSGQHVATGAGGAKFCVVTAEKGSKANIEVFSTGSKKVKRDLNVKEISELFNGDAIKDSSNGSNSGSTPEVVESNDTSSLEINLYAAVVGVFGILAVLF